MASANDMDAANKTYNSFIGTLKWLLPLTAVVTALIVVVIA